MGYDAKGILVFNLKYEHVISFISLVKFIIKCKYHPIFMCLFVLLRGEANFLSRPSVEGNLPILETGIFRK